MFRISRFHDLLKGLPRARFNDLVAHHRADKHSKGFGCWDQLVAMVYGHMAGVGSLRELEAGFNSHSNHHYHLGTRTVRRSTLAEANGRRNPQVFAAAAQQLMAGVHRQLRQEGQDLLYLLDSTSITLKGLGFDDWTLAERTGHGQGLKVHVLYADHAAIPVDCRFSAANVNDIDMGKALPLQAQATYVFDKGYCDYNWWAQLDEHQARFVTRFKYNAALKTLARRPIPPHEQELVLHDEEVCFAHRHPGGSRINRYNKPLRRIVVARPDHDRPLILATNDFDSPAGEIARLYRRRWQIELFFKWIKQHLKIKRFLGRSENAVRIQILCALISFLLLRLHHHRSNSRQTLWLWMAELRASLFQRPEAEINYYRRRQERLREMDERQGQLFTA